MILQLKINKEYLVQINQDIVRIKVLELTSKCIKVHNIDEDFVKRYLLSDYKPEIIEELDEIKDVYDEIEEVLSKPHDQKRSEILNAVNIPVSAIIPSELYDDEEVWRLIPDMKHPYLLSNKGRVKNSQGKISTPVISRVGTHFVGLTDKKGMRSSHRVDTLLNQLFGVDRKV